MRAWEFRRSAAAFLMPNRCPFCGEIIGVREFWCMRCFNRLGFIDDPGSIPQGVDAFSAVCRYAGNARTAVLRMKKGYYRYPIDAFAVLIAENAHEMIAASDIITAIPSSGERRREIGYAHSELIAGMVSKISRIPMRRVLGVTGEKLEQKSLDAVHRYENARRAFRAVHPEKVQGKRILVIDDVCTTGATLSAAAHILREAGAESVNAAVFARTIKRH